MAESTTAALVSAPPFIRLLASQALTDPAKSPPALIERLGQWVDWNHAVALARVLDQPPPQAPDALDNAPGEAECAQARATLTQAIAEEPLLCRRPAADSAAWRDFAPYRERCLSLQRAMQGASGRLRGGLRDRLAMGAPAQARLAELDALMEQILSPREQRWLTAVPGLLGERFERLRPTPVDAADAVSPPIPGDWQDAFRQEMRDVLLAELDFRFQPLEALLAALRA